MQSPAVLFPVLMGMRWLDDGRIKFFPQEIESGVNRHWSGRWVRLPEVALRAGGPAEEPICVRSGAEERAEEAQLPDGVRVAGTRVGGTRRRSADFLRASGRRST